MKYNIGDKVKVREDLVMDCFKSPYANSKMLEFNGKELTIKGHTENGYYEVEENYWIWRSDMFEGKVEDNSEDNLISFRELLDMEVKPNKILFYSFGGFWLPCTLNVLYNKYVLDSSKKSLGEVMNLRAMTAKNIKIVPEPILDEIEKEYLEGVIYPFKDRVRYIKKYCNYTHHYISICVEGIHGKEECIGLPYFDKYTMYKGMETDKKYTLEELGLFKGE